MPTGDEYSAGGGGKLKLKGSKVSDGRVEKKKAKKAKKKEQAASNEAAASSSNDDGRRGEVEKEKGRVGGGEDSTSTEDPARIEESRREDGSLVVGKTETERQYEEIRRKRLFERIQRDGVKTHKERVEELNKYLSGLTEHHDMPKIGPG